VLIEIDIGSIGGNLDNDPDPDPDFDFDFDRARPCCTAGSAFAKMSAPQ